MEKQIINTMAKFKLGSYVKYNGSNKSLKGYFSNGMSVEDIIPAGVPFGNGEINNSGEDFYLVMHGYTRYHFKESELTAAYKK